MTGLLLRSMWQLTDGAGEETSNHQAAASPTITLSEEEESPLGAGHGLRVCMGVCVCVDLCASESDTMTPKALALFPQQAGLGGKWQSIHSR